MAETSKNKIYYNDDENSKADVLADMKKMAESTDKAIENSKYNDAAIKKNISDIEEKQAIKDSEQDSKIVELQTEKAKLETELKEMQEDFYQNSIRGQASGEYIHVEDSSNCRAKIGIGGNSEQETRSGKNLLELMEGTYSNNGITAVVKDGIITLNGTATAISFVGINLLKSLELTNNKTYHLSAFNEKTAGDSTNYCSLRINQDNIQVLFNTANVNSSITTNLKISYITIRTAQGITYNNFVVKPQLELGAGTNEWEQGGASPSPDYPSEIKTVGSNVNLFNKDNYIKSKLYINKNENKFSEASMGKSFIFDISKYNKLTISKVSSERFGVFASVDYPQKDGVGTYLQDVATKTTSFTYDFTEFNYLVVMYYLTSGTITEQQILDSIKIVEGTEIGEYSKFGQGCVKVTKCNKNLYNENNKLMNATINSNGIISTGQDNYLLYFPVEYGHKYIFSTDFSESLTTNAVFGYCNEIPSIGVLSTYNVISLSNLKNKIFTPIDEKNKYLCIRLNYKTQYNKMRNIQLEENTVSTAYEEHQEETYIMPVQQEMLEDDYFDWDNEEEVHVWDKLVLTGDEKWYANVNSGWQQNSHIFALPFSGVETNGQSTNVGQVLKCNYFSCENTGTLVWREKNYISYYPAFKNGSILINHQGISTETDFEAWLKSQYDAGRPVIVYYQLATPKRLKFTNEQKAVAKELNNARTYKNVTNITTDSKAIIDLDYVKDQETQNQKMQNEIDEIKQLLSTTQTSAMLLDNLQKEVESEVE